MDRAGKDCGRVAAFSADPTRRPPELGAIVHFLRTLANSKQRRQQSVLLHGFLKMVSNWSGSHWVLDENGLTSFLNVVTFDYRNLAAHTTELGQAEYTRCRDLVLGSDGALGIHSPAPQLREYASYYGSKGARAASGELTNRSASCGITILIIQSK